MGIKYFNIEYDGAVFYPGQTVSGRVRLSLDQPKILKVIKLKLVGEANCYWTEDESYTDSDGKSQTRSESYRGNENYFKTKLVLAGDGSKFELDIGDYVYPFSITLPAALPPSYYGTYGNISYYGEAKLVLPSWTKNKCERKTIFVEVPIDLNLMPQLNEVCEKEESKTFCCWCCASKPLTVCASIPRSGFAYTEAIPITIEVDNSSNVDVNSIKVELNQIINWRASLKTKTQTVNIKKLKLGGVERNLNHSWSEIMALGPDKYPHSGTCGIIFIHYELRIELDASGPHRDLELRIPILIGTIPYGAPSSNLMGVGYVPTRQPLRFSGFSDPCQRANQVTWVGYVCCGLFCIGFLLIASFIIYGIIQVTMRKEHRFP